MKKIRKNNKKKKIMLIGIIVLVILVTTICILVFGGKKSDLVLIKDLNVEINSEVTLLSFVDEVKNGSVISEDKEIDTSKLGRQELAIEVKNGNKTKKYEFTINVVDTTKPEIDGISEITTIVGEKIDLLEGVTVSDNSKEDIKVEIKGDYDFNKEGEYELEYYAKDSSGNEISQKIKLIVVSDPNNMTFTTSKGFKGKVIDGVTYIDDVLIANKTYSLPSDYGNGLTSTTQSAFDKMNADAKSLGLNLWIASGYRSYATQKRLYNNYVSSDGKEAADTYSARPGYSEHQTGLAFDLNSVEESFANTDEGKWVKDNCYRYGLIIRYPKGKESITGYIYEPWHLRYVGVELATKLYNNGDWITLEEYFGVDSKYKD